MKTGITLPTQAIFSPGFAFLHLFWYSLYLSWCSVLHFICLICIQLLQNARSIPFCFPVLSPNSERGFIFWQSLQPFLFLYVCFINYFCFNNTSSYFLLPSGINTGTPASSLAIFKLTKFL
jgi:hypothetical protein